MMIYFHILLVHLGGNACFEYLAFTVLMESCTIRGTMMVWSFWFFLVFVKYSASLQVTESVESINQKKKIQ